MEDGKGKWSWYLSAENYDPMRAINHATNDSFQKVYVTLEEKAEKCSTVVIKLLLVYYALILWYDKHFGG